MDGRWIKEEMFTNSLTAAGGTSACWKLRWAEVPEVFGSIRQIWA